MPCDTSTVPLCRHMFSGHQFLCFTATSISLGRDTAGLLSPSSLSCPRVTLSFENHHNNDSSTQLPKEVRYATQHHPSLRHCETQSGTSTDGRVSISMVVIVGQSSQLPVTYGGSTTLFSYPLWSFQWSITKVLVDVYSCAIELLGIPHNTGSQSLNFLKWTTLAGGGRQWLDSTMFAPRRFIEGSWSFR